MAERIDELPVAIAPEHVADRHLDLGARLDGAFERGVGVLDVEVQRDGRAFERVRRLAAGLRELVVQQQHRVADLQLRVHDQPAVGADAAEDFARAERGLVEVDRARRAADLEVRGQRMEAGWDRVPGRVLGHRAILGQGETGRSGAPSGAGRRRQYHGWLFAGSATGTSTSHSALPRVDGFGEADGGRSSKISSTGPGPRTPPAAASRSCSSQRRTAVTLAGPPLQVATSISSPPIRWMPMSPSPRRRGPIEMPWSVRQSRAGVTAGSSWWRRTSSGSVTGFRRDANATRRAKSAATARGATGPVRRTNAMRSGASTTMRTAGPASLRGVSAGCSTELSWPSAAVRTCQRRTPAGCAAAGRWRAARSR